MAFLQGTLESVGEGGGITTAFQPGNMSVSSIRDCLHLGIKLFIFCIVVVLINLVRYVTETYGNVKSFGKEMSENFTRKPSNP